MIARKPPPQWGHRLRRACATGFALAFALGACGDRALLEYNLRAARRAMQGGELGEVLRRATEVLREAPAHLEALDLFVAAKVRADGANGREHLLAAAAARPDDPMAVYLGLRAATASATPVERARRFRSVAAALSEASRRHPGYWPLVRLHARGQQVLGDFRGAFETLARMFVRTGGQLTVGVAALEAATAPGVLKPLRAWRRQLPKRARSALKGASLVWAVHLARESLDEQAAPVPSIRRALARWRRAEQVIEAASSPCVRAIVTRRVARVLWKRHQQRAGLDELARVVATCRAAPDPTMLPARLRGLAGLQKLVGDFGAAAASYEALAALHRERGQAREEAKALLDAATDRSNAGDSRAALALLARAQKVIESLADVRLRIDLDVARGTECAHRNASRCAVQAFAAALRFAEATGDSKRIAGVLADYGRVLSDAGDYARAVQVLERARTLEQRLGGVGPTVLVNLGAAYRGRGEPLRALALYRSAARLLRKNRALRRFHAIALANIGNVYRAIGEDERALRYYRRALAEKKGVANDRELAETWRDIAVCLRNLDRPTQSAAAARNALERFRKAGARVRAVEVELFLLDLESARLAPAQQLARVDAAVRALREADARTELATTLFVRALRRSSTGDDRGALADLAESEALEAATGGTPRWHTPYLRGLILQKSSARAAHEAMRLAAQRLDAERVVYRATTFKTAFLERRAFVYQTLARMALQQGEEKARVANAFAAAERGKARGLLDLLGERGARVTQRPGLDDGRAPDVDAAELRARVERARVVATALQKRAARLGVAQGPRAERARAALERRRDDALRTLDHLQAELEAASPLGRTAHPGAPVTLSAVQASLPMDATLLAYAVGERDTLLFQVTRTAARAHVLPHGQRELEALVRDYRNEVLLRPDLRRPKAAARAGRALFDKLLAPASRRGLARALVVVPDGPLTYLPFEALVTPNPKALPGDLWAWRPRYVVESHAVTYAPSASVLLALRERAAHTRAAPRGLAAVGDPSYALAAAGGAPTAARRTRGLRERFPQLPSTAAEVRAIARAVPGPHTLLLGREAREERVKAGVLRGHRFVHFATHGLLDEGFQALVLTQDPTSREDGFLERREIHALDIDAELVTLSACDTGSGKLISGEGVVGLAQAFFYAGAPRLVVSLWQVEDRATSRLMTTLYGALGPPGALALGAALRTAKRALLANPATRAPYYWAAFVASGVP